VSTHAVIAVRGGGAAKSRCGPALDAAGRADLIEAMLGDMIEALQASPSLNEVLVVTPTAELAALAQAAGASVLLESTPLGINAAFEAARAQIRDRDPSGVIVALPGDLPLLEQDEIARALAALAPRGAVLVPASADGGTGAVIVHAEAPFAFQFGEDSFRRHRAAAAAAGLAPKEVHAAGLGLDIDRPADLEAVLHRAASGRTARVLQQHMRAVEPSR